MWRTLKTTQDTEGALKTFSLRKSVAERWSFLVTLCCSKSIFRCFKKGFSHFFLSILLMYKTVWKQQERKDERHGSRFLVTWIRKVTGGGHCPFNTCLLRLINASNHIPSLVSCRILKNWILQKLCSLASSVIAGTKDVLSPCRQREDYPGEGPQGRRGGRTLLNRALYFRLLCAELYYRSPPVSLCSVPDYTAIQKDLLYVGVISLLLQWDRQKYHRLNSCEISYDWPGKWCLPG